MHHAPDPPPAHALLRLEQAGIKLTYRTLRSAGVLGERPTRKVPTKHKRGLETHERYEFSETLSLSEGAL